MAFDAMCDWVREIFDFQKQLNAEEKKAAERAKKRQSKKY